VLPFPNPGRLFDHTRLTLTFFWQNSKGIFDEKRHGMRGGFAGKDGESSFGPGMSLKHNKGDGYFEEDRPSRFSGKASATSLEHSDDGIVGKRGNTLQGIFGPTKNKHAGERAR